MNLQKAVSADMGFYNIQSFVVVASLEPADCNVYRTELYIIKFRCFVHLF